MNGYPSLKELKKRYFRGDKPKGIQISLRKSSTTLNRFAVRFFVFVFLHAFGENTYNYRCPCLWK